MTAVADLELRARLVGDARREIRASRQDLVALDRQQTRALRAGMVGADRLARSWDRAGMAIRGAHRHVTGLAGEILSVKGLVLGVAGGAGARTLFDSLIGSNMELEAKRTTFRTMIGDAERASKLMRDIEGYAARTPLLQDDLLEGSKRLLRLTKDNVDWNFRLTQQAAKMAAINPSKTTSDAAEALLDAQQLEFERLKEFGIKLRKEDVKRMRKRGETLGEAALRGVTEALEKQTGGRDVVGALSKTLRGKASTFRDRFTIFMRRAGEPAFDALKDGMDDVMASFDRLEADPQFQQDVREMGQLLADGAKHALIFATKVPEGIRELRAFYQEHEDVLKVGAGLVVANKLTGGAVARGGGALLSAGAAGAGRLLFGKKGGGAAAGLSASAAGAIPVYVVNGGDLGMGLGSGLGSALKGGAGAGAASYGNGLFGSLASKGLIGTLAGGGLAASSLLAGGAIAGSIGGGVAALAHATEGTSTGRKRLEREATEREERARKLRERAERDERQRTLAERRKHLVGEAASYASVGSLDRAKGLLSELAVRAKTPEERKTLEQMADRAFANQNLDVGIGEGGMLSFSAMLDQDTFKRRKSAIDLFRRSQNPQRGDDAALALSKDPQAQEDLVRFVASTTAAFERAGAMASGLKGAGSRVGSEELGELQAIDLLIRGKALGQKAVQVAQSIDVGGIVMHLTVQGNQTSEERKALVNELGTILPDKIREGLSGREQKR